MANEIKITIGADTKKADQAVKGFRKRLDAVSKKAKVAGVAFGAMGGAGVVAIKGFAEAALVQQRAMDTLATVMGNAGESFDDMEDHIMSTTAALQKKTNYGDEAQLRVLAQLVPMLGSTEDALAALPAIMDVAAVTGKDFESTVMTMGPVLAGLTNTVRGTSLQFDKSQGPMERVAAIIKDLGGAAEAQADPFTQMSNAMGDLKESIGMQLLPVIKPLVGAVQSFAERLQAANPRLIKIAALVLAGATAFGLIMGPILLLIGFLPAIAAGFAMVSVAMGPITLVVLGIAAAIAAIIVVWKSWDRITRAFSATLDFIKDAFNSKIGWLLPGGALIKAILFIKDSWRSVWEGIKSTFKSITDGIMNIATKFKDGFVDAFRGMKDIVMGIWDVLVSGVKGYINTLISGVNFIIRAVNRIKIPSFFGFGGMSMNIAEVRPMAKGGIVTRPTMALLGESGPEAVVPLGAGGTIAGGIVVNITGNHITGEMELDRLVRRAITSAGVRGAF